MKGGWLFYSWLCLLLLDVSIGCVSHSFQNVSFFPFFFSFFIIVFGLVTDFRPFLSCER